MAVKTVKTKAAKKAAAVVPRTLDRKPAQPAAKKVAAPAKAAAKAAPVKASVKAAPTKTPVKAVPAAPAKPVAKCILDQKTMQQVRDTLIKTRERLSGQMLALADDSLKYIDDTSSEDRTDDFDREFALNLVSTEHDAVFEIDNALRRMAEGTYGVCDMCGCALEKARLMALPFARMCVKCQSESERGRSRFRPFGESLAQGVEPAAEPSEAEETE